MEIKSMLFLQLALLPPISLKIHHLHTELKPQARFHFTYSHTLN